MNDLLTKNFDSDSEDEEYIPTKKELESSEDSKKGKLKKTVEEENECKKKVNDQWEKLQSQVNNKPKTEELKEEGSDKTEEEKLDEQIKEALRKVKEQKKKTVKETYYFAGQKFEDTKEVNDKEIQKMKKKETHKNLDLFLAAISKKKNISTMDKSKKDWNAYVEEHKIEKELMMNRKDGYLGKKRFLENADAVIQEQNKIMAKKAKFAYEMKMANK
ncbi:MAG: BCNT domain-containing protein [archaeon]|nr:BCNT domain-containing protein [archaeon]